MISHIDLPKRPLLGQYSVSKTNLADDRYGLTHILLGGPAVDPKGRSDT
jgi:hypothetical protein